MNPGVTTSFKADVIQCQAINLATIAMSSVGFYALPAPAYRGCGRPRNVSAGHGNALHYWDIVEDAASDARFRCGDLAPMAQKIFIIMLYIYSCVCSNGSKSGKFSQLY